MGNREALKWAYPDSTYVDCVFVPFDGWSEERNGLGIMLYHPSDAFAGKYCKEEKDEDGYNLQTMYHTSVLILPPKKTFVSKRSMEGWRIGDILMRINDMHYWKETNGG